MNNADRKSWCQWASGGFTLRGGISGLQTVMYYVQVWPQESRLRCGGLGCRDTTNCEQSPIVYLNSTLLDVKKHQTARKKSSNQLVYILCSSPIASSFGGEDNPLYNAHLAVQARVDQFSQPKKRDAWNLAQASIVDFCRKCSAPAWAKRPESHACPRSFTRRRSAYSVLYSSHGYFATRLTATGPGS